MAPTPAVKNRSAAPAAQRGAMERLPPAARLARGRARPAAGGRSAAASRAPAMARSSGVRPDLPFALEDDAGVARMLGAAALGGVGFWVGLGLLLI